MSNTTLNAAKAWAPDVSTFAAAELLPDLLLNKITTVAGSIEGDEPSLLVAYMDDLDADFVAEGAEITAQEATLAQTEVKTHKVAVLTEMSSELARQGGSTHLSDGMKRAVTLKANSALLNNLADPTGILNDAGLATAVALGDNLDAVTAAIWQIADTGASADYVLASPTAMGALALLKSGTGSNQPLVTDMNLYGLPVIVDAGMAANTVMVGSKSAIVSATGSVLLATSGDSAFSRDAVQYRVTYRSGWTVKRADRLVVIDTTPAA